MLFFLFICRHCLTQTPPTKWARQSKKNSAKWNHSFMQHDNTQEISKQYFYSKRYRRANVERVTSLYIAWEIYSIKFQILAIVNVIYIDILVATDRDKSTNSLFQYESNINTDWPNNSQIIAVSIWKYNGVIWYFWLFGKESFRIMSTMDDDKK